jgi:hypothetical protein
MICTGMIIEGRITDRETNSAHVGDTCVSRGRIVMKKGVTTSPTVICRTVIHNHRVTGAGESLKPRFTTWPAADGSFVVKQDSSHDCGIAANLDSCVLAQLVDRRVKRFSFHSRTRNSGAIDGENVMGIRCQDERTGVCREHDAIHGRVSGDGNIGHVRHVEGGNVGRPHSVLCSVSSWPPCSNSY